VTTVQARHVLDEHPVGDHVLVCDWLKPAAASPPKSSKVLSLHSKCLFVDGLPEDYRDMGEFRRMFSKVVNPPYCQVGTTFVDLKIRGRCCDLLNIFAEKNGEEKRRFWLTIKLFDAKNWSYM
jgi:hypothetical protein